MSKPIHTRRVSLSAVAVAAATVSGIMHSQEVLGQSVYTGANNGNWTAVGNWSLGVPSSTTDARVNNNASNVTVLVDAASNVRALTIDAGDAVSINNAQRLGLFGNLTNNGTLTVGSTGGNTYLMPSGNVTLSGTGTVRLTNSTAWFYDISNVNGVADHLTNAAGHSIRGRGIIGFSTTTRITNQGLIEADVAASSLTVTPNADGLTNTGTLRAINGADLTLAGASTTYTNTGGTLDAQSGSTITYVGNTFVGGQLIGAGTHQAGTAIPTFDAVAVSALLEVPNARQATLRNTITNNNVIRVNSTGANTYLGTSGTVTFAGTGVVEMIGAASWLYDQANANSANDHLINSAGHTIRGFGNIGFASTTQITNNGLIETDTAGNTLTVTPNSSGLINTGTLRARGTSTLALAGPGVTYANTNAVINAQDAGSVVTYTGNTVVGGQLTGAGTHRVGASIPTFDAVTVSALLEVSNARQATLRNTITNNNVIRVNSTGANTYLGTSGTVTFAGTGVVEMIGAASWLYDNANVNGAADHIINSTGHTIRGFGNIGFASTTQITNNGLIETDTAGNTLTVTPNSSGLINTGTLRARGTSTLALAGPGATYTNTNAVINAQDAGSVVTYTGNTVVGGQLTGAGTHRVGASIPTFDAVTVSALLEVPNARQATLRNTITNNNVIRVNSTGGNTYLGTSGTFTFAGTGAVELVGSASWLYDNANVNGVADHIINSAGHTIRGFGNIGFSTTTQITNNGLILANVTDSTLRLLPNASGFANNGTLRATNGGILELSEGVGTALYSGTGPLVVDAGSFIEAGANTGGTLGAVTGPGTLRATNTGSTLSFQNFNVGSIEATVNGVLRLTAGGGNAGISVVTDSITIVSNGRVDIADHGVVFNYTGASPAASVRTQLTTGRSTGTWFGANGIVSSLANNNGRAIGYGEASSLLGPTGGMFFGRPADGTSVLILFTLEGDTNLDRSVNFVDLLALARNYNPTAGKVWSDGDFNYDGLVNFTDLLTLARNYGLSLSSSEASLLSDIAGADFITDWNAARTAIPEPATLGLIAGVAALSLRRRVKA